MCRVSRWSLLPVELRYAESPPVATALVFGVSAASIAKGANSLLEVECLFYRP